VCCKRPVYEAGEWERERDGDGTWKTENLEREVRGGGGGSGERGVTGIQHRGGYSCTPETSELNIFFRSPEALKSAHSGQKTISGMPWSQNSSLCLSRPLPLALGLSLALTLRSVSLSLFLPFACLSLSLFLSFSVSLYRARAHATACCAYRPTFIAC
jgi:hypothetical protein